MKRVLMTVLMVTIAMGVFAAGGQEGETTTVVFADASWDSILVHNRIAAFILENGYGGYRADYIPGDTIPVVNGMAAGDIDVMMESWHENYQERYDELIAAGEIVNVGDNMPEAPQGWYVPRYLVEGDSERGIEPEAPGLTSMEDLPAYWELFRDPENPDKGRILIGPPGWVATERGEQMMEDYALTDTYTAFLPGSGTALAASMVGAYERGEPWLGYYWEPTAVLGRLDMIRVKGSEFPPTSVDVLMNAGYAEAHPELTAFFEAYSTSLPQNNEFLAAMEEDGLDAEGAARYFLENHEETWTSWVSDEVADRVRAALQD